MTDRDQAALVIFQNNPRDIAEMLLDRYFGRMTVAELDCQLSAVSEAMACQTDTKQSLSSSAPSQSA